MTFGQEITKARKDLGLKQKELAARIVKEDGNAISLPYLNDIEHDRRSPSSDHLIEQFAEALNIPSEILYLLAERIPSAVAEVYRSKRATDKTDYKRAIAAYKAFRKELERGVAA